MKKKYLICFILLSVGIVQAQDNLDQPKSESSGDLANKIQNPIADLVSIPFQNNLEFNDENLNTLNIQPVTPFGLGSKANVILRTIIPIVSAPLPTGRLTGLGGVTMSAFVTPSKPSKFIWGVGPAIQFPTGKQYLGSEKFSIAPSLIMLYQNNGWTVGGLFQNFWSVAGPVSATDVNFFYSQIFVTKNLSKGWYVNTAPIITTSWDLKNEGLTLPIGAGVGRLFRAGKLPINAQAGYYHYLKHPTDAIGQLRLQLNIILPKFY